MNCLLRCGQSLRAFVCPTGFEEGEDMLFDLAQIPDRECAVTDLLQTVTSSLKRCNCTRVEPQLKDY
jgi:hypothetical protein